MKPKGHARHRQAREKDANNTASLHDCTARAGVDACHCPCDYPNTTTQITMLSNTRVSARKSVTCMRQRTPRDTLCCTAPTAQSVGGQGSGMGAKEEKGWFWRRALAPPPSSRQVGIFCRNIGVSGPQRAWVTLHALTEPSLHTLVVESTRMSRFGKLGKLWVHGKTMDLASGSVLQVDNRTHNLRGLWNVSTAVVPERWLYK